MPDIIQTLRDFVATSNSGKYADEQELLSKFPELQGYDIELLKDFVATSNSGKYSDEQELLSKFPEFNLSPTIGLTPSQRRTQQSMTDLGQFRETITPEEKAPETVGAMAEYTPPTQEQVDDADYEWARRTMALNEDLLGDRRQKLIPKLSYLFGDYGFRFEPSIKESFNIIAPNGEKINIKSYNLFESGKTSELAKLEDFIGQHKPGEEILISETPESRYAEKIVDDSIVSIKQSELASEDKKISKSIGELGVQYALLGRDIVGQMQDLQSKFDRKEISEDKFRSEIEKLNNLYTVRVGSLSRTSENLQERISGIQGDSEAMSKALNRYGDMKKMQQDLVLNMFRSFEAGIMEVSKSLWETPSFIFDLAAHGYNLLAEGFEAVGAPRQYRMPLSSEIGDALGISNVNAHLLARRAEELHAIETEYDGSIVDYIQQGEYGLASKAVAVSIAESLPFTLAIMGGGYAGVGTGTMFAGTTAVMGAGRYADIKNEEDHGQAMKLSNSTIYGIAEAFEVLLGGGSFGRSLRKIAQKDGIGKAKQFASKTMATLIDENPYLSPLKEGLQEVTTQILQNIADVELLGEDKSITEGVGDAFIVGAVMGSGFSAVQITANTIQNNVVKKERADFLSRIQEISQSGAKYQNVLNDINRQVEDLEITEEAGVSKVIRLNSAINAYRQLPEELSDKKKADALPLLMEKIAIEKKIEGKDKTLVEDELARIEEINKQLKKLKAQKDVETEQTEEVEPTEQPRTEPEDTEQTEVSETGEEVAATEAEGVESEVINETLTRIEEIDNVDDLYSLYDEVDGLELSQEDKSVLQEIIEEEIIKKEQDETKPETKVEATPEGEAVTSVGRIVEVENERKEPRQVAIAELNQKPGVYSGQSGVFSVNEKGQLDFIAEDGTEIPIDTPFLGFVNSVKDENGNVVSVRMFDSKNKAVVEILDSEIARDIAIKAMYDQVEPIDISEYESVIDQALKETTEPTEQVEQQEVSPVEEVASEPTPEPATVEQAAKELDEKTQAKRKSALAKAKRSLVAKINPETLSDKLSREDFDGQVTVETIGKQKVIKLGDLILHTQPLERFTEMDKAWKAYKDLFVSPEQKKQRKERFLNNLAKEFEGIDLNIPEAYILHWFLTGGRISFEQARARTGYNKEDYGRNVSENGLTFHEIVESVQEDLPFVSEDVIIDIVENYLDWSHNDMRQEIKRFKDGYEMAMMEEMYGEMMREVEGIDEVSDSDMEALSLTDEQAEALNGLIAHELVSQGQPHLLEDAMGVDDLLDKALTNSERAALDAIIASNTDESGVTNYDKVTEELTDTKAKEDETTREQTESATERESGQVSQEGDSVTSAPEQAETPLTAKALAKAKLDAAKKAFDAKMRGSMQLGGLHSLPEFVNLVKAYIELGVVNAADFIKEFKQLVPDSTMSDWGIKRAFEAAKKQIQDVSALKSALRESKKETTKLRNRVKALETSKEGALEKSKKLAELRKDLADYINNNFPKGEGITQSIAKDIATAKTPKQIENVLKRIDNLAERIEKAREKAEAKKQEAEAAQTAVLEKEAEKQRLSLINEIKKKYGSEKSFVRKSQTEKLGKAVIDAQAREEITKYLESLTTPLEEMTTQELQELQEILDLAYNEGRVRIRQLREAKRRENKMKSLRLTESISDKKSAFKPISTIEEGIRSLANGDVVRMNGKLYDKSMLDEFISDSNMYVPTVTVGGEVYNVKVSKISMQGGKVQRQFTVTQMNSAGKLIPVKRSDPARAKAIDAYNTAYSQATQGQISAEVTRIPKLVGRLSRRVAGAISSNNTFLGFLYDLTRTSKQLERAEADLYRPAMIASKNKTETEFRLKNKYREARKKIFGSNLAAHRYLIRGSNVRLVDRNGVATNELTNAEMVYLYNILMRSEMIDKFSNSGFGLDMIDKIYDYVLKDPKLKAHADLLRQQYSDYLPEVNAVLERTGEAPIIEKRVPTKEQLTKRFSREFADKYYSMLERALGSIPMYEPYSPASVVGQEMGNLQEVDLFGDRAEALSVISNNAIAARPKGDLQIRNSEVMFESWVDGMANMTSKLELFKTFMAVFNQSNMKLIENLYGMQYARQFKDAITSVILGRAARNPFSTKAGNWFNRSTAVIMFMNFASAIYQKISFLNYAFEAGILRDYVSNWGKYLWNKEYRQARKEVWNAEWVQARLRGNLSSQELRDINESTSKQDNVTDILLNKGYTPTKVVDINSIVSGGTPYYMARRNQLQKQYEKTMPKKEAEARAKEAALEDLFIVSNQSQQTSEQPEMSAQQRNPMLRTFLSFGSVGLQYTRIMLRAARDIKRGKGDLSNNLARIVYFGMAQNMIFNFVSKGLSALLTGDDDDEMTNVQKNAVMRSANATADGLLRGLGWHGAVIMVAKNYAYDVFLMYHMGRIRELEKEEKARISTAKRIGKEAGRDVSMLREDPYVAEMHREVIDFLVDAGENRSRVERLSPVNATLEAIRSLNPPLGHKIGYGTKIGARVGEGNLLRVATTGVEALANIPIERAITITENIMEVNNESLTAMERALRMVNILKKYDVEQRTKREEKAEEDRIKNYQKLEKEKERMRKQGNKDMKRLMREYNPDLYKQMQASEQIEKDIKKMLKQYEQ